MKQKYSIEIPFDFNKVYICTQDGDTQLLAFTYFQYKVRENDHSLEVIQSVSSKSRMCTYYHRNAIGKIFSNKQEYNEFVFEKMFKG